MILGLGALLAGFVCPTLFAKMKVGDVVNFRSLFLIPMSLTLIGATLLALFFRPPTMVQPAAGGGAAPAH